MHLFLPIRKVSHLSDPNPSFDRKALSFFYPLGEDGSQPLFSKHLQSPPSPAPATSSSRHPCICWWFQAPALSWRTVHTAYLAKKQPKRSGAHTREAREAASELLVTAISLDIALLVQMVSWVNKKSLFSINMSASALLSGICQAGGMVSV